MATNLIYQKRETLIDWLSTGGTELFTPTSLGVAAGRQGAYHDFGTVSIPLFWEWRAWTQWNTTPVLNELLYLYFITSDGTHPDNDDGTGDIAISTIDKLVNLDQLGAIEVDEAATGIKVVAGGRIKLRAQWGAPAWWNDTADILSATASHHGFRMWPSAPDIQAAA